MHLRVTNNRPKHSMFTLLVSNPQVRLGSLTNTQGSPHNRLAILASQNSGMHVLICNLALAEVMMKPLELAGREYLNQPGEMSNTVGETAADLLRGKRTDV